MGTVFSIDIRPPLVAGGVLDEVVAWLHQVDATFSTYRPDSPVSRLAAGELSLAECPPEVAEILARCAELERDTAGYFSAYAAGRLDPSGLVKGWAIESASHRLRAAGSVNHCVNGGGDVQCAGDAAPGQPWRVGIANPLRSVAALRSGAVRRSGAACGGGAEPCAVAEQQCHSAAEPCGGAEQQCHSLGISSSSSFIAGARPVRQGRRGELRRFPVHWR